MNATYGYLVEFADASSLLAAVREMRQRGYTSMDAYTPYPVEGLAEALGPLRDRVPLLMLLGGLLGGLGTLGLQYYSAVINYPIDVGGRPDASWPAFVPAALEMTLLFAAVAGVVGMLVSNGLPRLHHPLFNSVHFEDASRDKFFLVLLAGDPRFGDGRVQRDLDQPGALRVEQVPQ